MIRLLHGLARLGISISLVDGGVELHTANYECTLADDWTDKQVESRIFEFIGYINGRDDRELIKYGDRR